MRGVLLLPVLLLAGTLLAGCSGGGTPDDCTGADCPGAGLDVDEDTGGIRGIVVDDSIRPVEGAKVVLMNGDETLTDAQGRFTFTGLAPGEHFITVSKPGYATMQATAKVVAGVAEPDVVKVVLEYLVDAQPYTEFHEFRGFYECGFAAPFITDSCDFGVRTVSDEENATTGTGAVPRGVQDNRNTMFVEVPASTVTIVQEAYWENPDVSSMMILLDSTPIDNACDCSERSYLETVGPSPTYGRVDGEAVPAGETVAVRGFLPFGDPQYAVNHEFQIFTTLFHNAPAPEGWSFVNGDEMPF